MEITKLRLTNARAGHPRLLAPSYKLACVVSFARQEFSFTCLEPELILDSQLIMRYLHVAQLTATCSAVCCGWQ